MKFKSITLALVTATVSLFGDQHQCIHKHYKADIVVVGGGAAGCILMNQLSEDGCFSVLGLEAGPNLTSDPAIEAVGLSAFLLAGTGQAKYFWPGWRQTLPMAGLNGRVSDWTTGMVLGGGSSINGLYYGRGSSPMYSRWEEISGSENWSLKNILATFTELENYHGLTITPGARGEKGNLSVLETPTVSALTKKVLLPASEAVFGGLPNPIPTVIDYNDPTSVNCIDPRAQWFIKPSGKKRESSATAYLNSKVMTPEGRGVNGHKLLVLFDSTAVKIVINKRGRAKKVKFMQDGKLCVVHVKKAIVLASGINSSKLLQLSGIGPKKILKNAGIEPHFINENVGKHLQNHPLIFITMLADPKVSGVPKGAPYAFTVNSIYLPVVGGKASDPRMLQILFEYIPADFLPNGIILPILGPTPLLVMGFNLLNPKSEGSVNIQSDNSFQIAAADDGFYQDHNDIERMVDALKFYIRPFLNRLASDNPGIYYRPVLTDPYNFINFNDDKSIESYVKNNSNLSLDIHHFTSHCKMAALEAGGVVDGDLRVYGTTNLFVADDSICPVIPDINTAGPAMMIGLRGSQIIKHIYRDSDD